MSYLGVLDKLKRSSAPVQLGANRGSASLTHRIAESLPPLRMHSYQNLTSFPTRYFLPTGTYKLTGGQTHMVSNRINIYSY